MFEAKPPLPAEGTPLDDESAEGEALRELTWAGLVARLSASRVVRVELERADEGCEASFDALSARRIAAHHSAEPGINLDASSYRKELDRMALPAVNGAGAEFGFGVAGK